MKKLLLFSVIVIVVVSSVVGYFYFKATPYNTRVLLDDHQIKVAVADSYPEQLKGLSGTSELRANEGMLFVYDQAEARSFWMKGMKYELDFVWIKEGTVIGTTENVSLFDQYEDISQVRSPWEVDMVLEMNAGFVATKQIEIGDRIAILDL